jgi:hypothetical protein
MQTLSHMLPCYSLHSLVSSRTVCTCHSVSDTRILVHFFYDLSTKSSTKGIITDTLPFPHTSQDFLEHIQDVPC